MRNRGNAYNADCTSLQPLWPALRPVFPTCADGRKYENSYFCMITLLWHWHAGSTIGLLHNVNLNSKLCLRDDQNAEVCISSSNCVDNHSRFKRLNHVRFLCVGCGIMLSCLCDEYHYVGLRSCVCTSIRIVSSPTSESSTHLVLQQRNNCKHTLFVFVCK